MGRGGWTESKGDWEEEDAHQRTATNGVVAVPAGEEKMWGS